MGDLSKEASLASRRSLNGGNRARNEARELGEDLKKQTYLLTLISFVSAPALAVNHVLGRFFNSPG